MISTGVQRRYTVYPSIYPVVSGPTTPALAVFAVAAVAAAVAAAAAAATSLI